MTKIFIACVCATIIAAWGVAHWNGIVVRWETAHELNIIGFNVYRVRVRDGRIRKVNAEMIPAEHIGQILGGTYRLLDTKVRCGVRYRYRIEAVVVSGNPETMETEIVKKWCPNWTDNSNKGDKS